MRRIDIIKRAGKNLKRSKLRTALTALAIAVGATTISMALAAGKGGQAYLENMAGVVGDKNAMQVTRKIIQAEASDPYELKKVSEAKSEDSSSKIDVDSYSLNENDVAEISKVKGVKKVSPVVSIYPESVRLENGEKIAVGASVKVAEKPMEVSASNLEDLKILPRGKVMAPKSFAKAVSLKEEELLGRKVVMEFTQKDGKKIEQTFEIAAVDKGKTDRQFVYENSFLLNNDDGVEIAKKQNGENLPYYSLMVSVNNGEDVAKIKDEISNLQKGERYSVSTFAEVFGTVQTALNIATSGLVGFGILAILASVFGIINTQYISVLERTSQIGLMKSLGAKKGDISKMFRYESAWIGFLGGVLGVAIANIFVLILNPVAEKTLGYNSAEIGGHLLRMDYFSSGIMVICLVVVAVISGYLPARKAAKMNPIEALRTE